MKNQKVYDKIFSEYTKGDNFMKNIILNISVMSSRILLIGFPVMFLCFLYLILSFTTQDSVSNTVLLHTYTPQLEHFMMSLTIIITGALLFDITEKEYKLIKK